MTWRGEIEQLARHLRDVDLQCALARNPARREMLRL
jgi:hypothetical protein